MLKVKRKKKKEQAYQLSKINRKDNANAQAQKIASEAEVQKQQALTSEKVAIEQAKSNFEMQRMQAEAQIKKELMAEEFKVRIEMRQIGAQNQLEI